MTTRKIPTINEVDINSTINTLTTLKMQIAAGEKEKIPHQKAISDIDMKLAPLKQQLTRLEGEYNKAQMDQINKNIETQSTEVEKEVKENYQDILTEDEDNYEDNYDEEYSDDSDYIEDESMFYVKFNDADMDGEPIQIIGKIYKIDDDSRWKEKILSGDSETFGSKTYMSYLTKDDIINWLEQDYENVEEILEDELDDYLSDEDMEKEIENNEEEPIILKPTEVKESFKHHIPKLEQ
jgi:hypothetical protein